MTVGCCEELDTILLSDKVFLGRNMLNRPNDFAKLLIGATLFSGSTGCSYIAPGRSQAVSQEKIAKLQEENNGLVAEQNEQLKRIADSLENLTMPDKK